MNLVTVLMPVYNTKEGWLRLAVESILAQTYRQFEFLIITDGPTDNSKTIVDEYARKDDRIRAVHNESNVGLIKTLNKGLSLATGDYIARMDSDDISLPNRLESQLKYIVENQVELVGGRLQKIDGDGEPIGSPTLGYSIKQVEKVLPYTDCIPHPTWFGKSELFKCSGGYREIKYCEDYDFLLRASDAGYRIGLCNEVLLNYRINTTGITRSNSLRQFLTSNYLKNNLARINEVTQEEIDIHLRDRVNDIESVKFERSMEHFRSGVTAIKDKHYLKGINSMTRGLFTSKYAFDNLKCIIKSNASKHS